MHWSWQFTKSPLVHHIHHNQLSICSASYNLTLRLLLAYASPMIVCQFETACLGSGCAFSLSDLLCETIVGCTFAASPVFLHPAVLQCDLSYKQTAADHAHQQYQCILNDCYPDTKMLLWRPLTLELSCTGLVLVCSVWGLYFACSNCCFWKLHIDKHHHLPWYASQQQHSEPCCCCNSQACVSWCWLSGISDVALQVTLLCQHVTVCTLSCFHVTICCFSCLCMAWLAGMLCNYVHDQHVKTATSVTQCCTIKHKQMWWHSLWDRSVPTCETWLSVQVLQQTQHYLKPKQAAAERFCWQQEYEREGQ